MDHIEYLERRIAQLEKTVKSLTRRLETLETRHEHLSNSAYVTAQDVSRLRDPYDGV